jgi:hypothetical protein
MFPFQDSVFIIVLHLNPESNCFGQTKKEATGPWVAQSLWQIRKETHQLPVTSI